VQPVSSLDAALLYAETAQMPLHTLGVIVLDAPVGFRGSPFATMEKLFRERIHQVGPFRRRLVDGPVGLGDPHWIEDPRFDLANHLLEVELPQPRGLRELAAFVGEYAGRLLDRRKPLWEMVLIPRLGRRKVAVVSKIHHAAMDGGRLVALIHQLFDEAPSGSRAPLPDQPWIPDSEPSPAWLVADTARALATRPWHAVRAIAEVTESMLERGQAAHPPHESRAGEAEPGTEPAAKLFEAPPTPFNRALTAHRSVAFADVPFRDLAGIKEAFGTTINDVVLAASCASLRAWLLAHGGLPERSLVANVPVTVRAAHGADGDVGNRVSMILAHLPVTSEDPVGRLLAIHAETHRAKERHGGSGGDVLRRFTDLVTSLASPWLLTHVVQLYSASHLADWMPVFWNLVISNLPGPATPLYCAGGTVTRIYPLGPVQQGSGLNLTVMSVADRLCLGAMACTELVPDVDSIVAGFADEIAVLKRLAPRRTRREARSRSARRAA
jgi:diacylglycerol O-acyltransferase